MHSDNNNTSLDRIYQSNQVLHSNTTSPSLPLHYYVETPSTEIDFLHWDCAHRIVPLSYFALSNQEQVNASYGPSYSTNIIRGDKGDIMLPKIPIIRPDLQTYQASLDSPFIPPVTLEDLACHPSYVLRSNSTQNIHQETLDVKITKNLNARCAAVGQRIIGSGSLERILNTPNESTNIGRSYNHPRNLPFSFEQDRSSYVYKSPPFECKEFEAKPIHMMTISEKESTQPNNECEDDKQKRKVKRYQCCYPDCPRAFTSPAHLKRHERIHSGLRPFACLVPMCDRNFTRRDNMIHHAKNHAKMCGYELSKEDIEASKVVSTTPRNMGDCNLLRLAQHLSAVKNQWRDQITSIL